MALSSTIVANINNICQYILVACQIHSSATSYRLRCIVDYITTYSNVTTTLPIHSLVDNMIDIKHK